MLNIKVIEKLKCTISHGAKLFSSVKNKSPIISCKYEHLNFYGQAYSKKEEIPLASKNWYHKKSKGDYFIIHRGQQEVISEVYAASNFHVTGLNSVVVQVAERENILVPTSIQYKSISKILQGRNTLITAETGCGKTLAYLLPILDLLLQNREMSKQRPHNSPLAVILTPSRDLVSQLYDVAKPFCKLLDLDLRKLVGGYTKKKLMNPVVDNVDIIIATPGIFSKFLTFKMIDPSYIRHVVLDEADTLLDESFEYKLSVILRKIKFRRDVNDVSKAQLTLVSATVPSDLSTHMSPFVDPESIVEIVSRDAHKVLPNLPQRFLRIGTQQKAIELLKIVRADVNKKNPLMIFSNKTKTCDWISLLLNGFGVRCVSLNGDLPIPMRNGAYAKYDSGEVDVISCTDMLSRGMDTIRTKHVLNYDFPLTTFDYIHRIGRTGRIGSSHGCHVTNFICRMPEILLAQKIEMSVRKLVDLPSADGNTRKILGDRNERSIERAREELMALTG